MSAVSLIGSKSHWFVDKRTKNLLSLPLIKEQGLGKVGGVDIDLELVAFRMLNINSAVTGKLLLCNLQLQLYMGMAFVWVFLLLQFKQNDFSESA